MSLDPQNVAADDFKVNCGSPLGLEARKQPGPGGPRRGSVTKLSLQNGIFNVLSVPLRDPWPPLINSELPVFGIDGCVLCLDSWKEFMVVLKSCPQSVKTCFLKTIINSWSTSHRVGESELLPCIFGCSGCEDNLKHYLWCDPLWTQVASACGLPSCFFVPASHR